MVQEDWYVQTALTYTIFIIIVKPIYPLNHAAETQSAHNNGTSTYACVASYFTHIKNMHTCISFSHARQSVCVASLSFCPFELVKCGALDAIFLNACRLQASTQTVTTLLLWLLSTSSSMFRFLQRNSVSCRYVFASSLWDFEKHSGHAHKPLRAS